MGSGKLLQNIPSDGGAQLREKLTGEAAVFVEGWAYGRLVEEY
jgi:hypothetical protein